MVRSLPEEEVVMRAIQPPTVGARRQGGRWSMRARAWAEQEAQQLPAYERALREIALRPGTTVLDVGCGSGVFLRVAADRGARVSGVDAAEALVRLARERVPGADVRVGDMEALP